MDEEPTPKRGLARNTANYGDRDFALYLRRSFAKSMGYSQAMLDRPVVGIVDTGNGSDGGDAIIGNFARDHFDGIVPIRIARNDRHISLQASDIVFQHVAFSGGDRKLPRIAGDVGQF